MEKRPDLLVLIAVWEFLSAVWILIPIAAIFSAFFFAAPGVWIWGYDGNMPNMAGIAIFVLGVVVLIMALSFVIALLGGIWLLQGREWGRILSIVQAALSILWIPIGTVIGILVLIYLTRPEVRRYFT